MKSLMMDFSKKKKNIRRDTQHKKKYQKNPSHCHKISINSYLQSQVLPNL